MIPARFLALLCPVAGVVASAEKTSGTVALTLEMQSPIVTLTLRADDGTERPTRFLVDTGGGALMLTEAVATELGIEMRRDAVSVEDGVRFAPMDTPDIAIDGFGLDLRGARCMAVLERSSVMRGCSAEGFLPGHVLARHHVVFDYPAGRFTLARPRAADADDEDESALRGTKIPSPCHPVMGFPRIELDVGGETLGFLLDTGASFTMVSVERLERWRKADPRLASAKGAVGEANMTGGPMETQALLMRLPEMTWGPFTLRDVAAVSRPAGTFEEYMSRMMTAPIVGALGGNALRHFRIEIDYAAGETYVASESERFGTELDTIGIVLGETDAGDHRVDALASTDGGPLCDGPRVGDLLRAVDGVPLETLCHRQVVELLGGVPGTPRVLLLERGTEAVELSLPVLSILGRSAAPPQTK